MLEFVSNHEIQIRLTLFCGVFFCIAVWELQSPRRQLSISKSLRWINNIGLVIFNSLLLRFLFPTAAVGVALYASDQHLGLFNIINLPLVLVVFVSVVLLDLAIYLQHVMVHAIPLFWRLHSVHHADLDYDVTTGARFHPIEIIFSMLIKFCIILLVGPPVVAVIIFEILLNATAMFNHGNLKLPTKVDKFLRLFIVTPDMHRVHHSVEENEANSNYGFNLPWWDRMFGTYQAQPKAGHKEMTIGIHSYRNSNQVSKLSGMLLMPFKNKVMGYAINKRRWE